MLKHLFLLALFLLSASTIADSVAKSPQDICLEHGERYKGRLVKSINDVSYLNQTTLSCIISPSSAQEVSRIVKSVNEWNKHNSKVHISISGTKHSQGGHIASKNGITLDMSNLNSVEPPQQKNGLWTVKAQAGALLSDIHNAIRQYEGNSFANKVQQSSTPFSVGGTLSVNAHGRSFSYGSVIHSVERITVVLPDGSITSASRAENSSLFQQVIGGYGLFGVIVDATLELNENHYVKANIQPFTTPSDYVDFLSDQLPNIPRHAIARDDQGNIQSITHSPTAFLFATLSLKKDELLEKTTSYRYEQLEDIDVLGTINSDPSPSLFNLMPLATKIGFWLRRKGTLISISEKMQRNFLEKQDTHLKVLTPPIKPILAVSTKKKPDLLQEYFIPISQIPDFIHHVKHVFSNNDSILSNASLRFIPKSADSSLLTYESASEDQLAMVLYFSLKLNKENIDAAEAWTQSLVEKAISLNGRYYLPYQRWPTIDQFQQAYPIHQTFSDLKASNDPNQVFSNSFYEYYFRGASD